MAYNKRKVLEGASYPAKMVCEDEDSSEEEEIDQDAMMKEFMDHAAAMTSALAKMYPDVEDYTCRLCSEVIEEDYNMGACGCGRVTRMCQQCGHWCENDSEWKCGSGLCVIKQEQCRFCKGKEQWTEEERESCLTCLRGDV